MIHRPGKQRVPRQDESRKEGKYRQADGWPN
jgi:hypothetical protein